MMAERHKVVASEGWAVPFCGPSTKCQKVARCDWPRQRLTLLTSTIEQEIVPRLVLAHNAAPKPDAVPVGDLIGDEDVATLARHATSRDPNAALAFVQSVRDRGVPLEGVLLHLLAPAARRLGDLWTEDLCDFADVTMGVWRLQQVLHELGGTFQDGLAQQEHSRRVLLVPAPGEQHTFGLVLVAEFFRQAGWTVWSEPLASSNDLIGIVRSEWFSVIGFSLSCDSRLESLAASIRRVRRASRNQAVGIMVGGQAFAQKPDLVAMVGADATAGDGRQAVYQAESLLSMRRSGD
ncbi:Cobalamin B12-binding domain-containing protein [Rhodovastum atsumiense]|nr:Cobalamin B12-binding domain-containing protein [Rhodovastum atsumiense]